MGERDVADDTASRPWSLRRRLLLLLSAVILLATTLQAWISYRTILVEADKMFDYQMQQMALAVQSSSGLPLIGPAEPIGEAEADTEDFAFVVIVRDMQGKMLFSNSAVALPPISSSGYTTRHVGRERYRVYTRVGAQGQVQVAQELEDRRELATQLALRTLWPMLASSVVILLSALLVVTQGLKPLTRLREQIVKRQPDDLRPLSQTSLPQEITPLIADVNALMVRMQNAYEAQRRFVADAAHALRTPLAAVLLQSEAVRRATTSELRELALGRQRGGIARATHLVDQLLALARQDTRATVADEDLASFAAIVEQSLADLEPAAKQKGIHIAADLGDVASARLPANAMRSVVDNLLDNAIKYTPALGRVRILALRDSNQLRVCIEDSGPGIPEEELQRVTDRFYRLPGNHAYGSGLGLAIVVEALGAMGGRLELCRSLALGGLNAVCRIPELMPPGG